MLLLAFLGVATSAVVNDFCSGAIAVPDTVTNQGSNVGSLYNSQTYYVDYNDVFYKYNATTTGTAIISATSTVYIQIAVFRGSSCNLLSPTTDEYWTTGSGYCTASTYAFPILQGQVYYFAIGGDGYPAPFSFTIATTTKARPAGDTCYNPIAIGPSGTNSALIDGAFQDDYHLYAGEPELFWTYTANCTGHATATLTSTLTNAIQNYYDNRCSYILGSGVNQRDQEDESGNSTITFPVINGQSYIIAGGPWSCSTPTGTFTIAVTCAAAAIAPNDVCTAAQTVSTGVQFVTSILNANENYNDYICGSLSGEDEVWLAWNSTCTGTATLNTNYSYVAVRRGSCSDGLQIYCSSGTTHAFSVQQGDNLWIALAVSPDATNIVGTISCAAVNNIPANTWCANAVAVNASQQLTTVSAVTDQATFNGNDYGTCYIYNQVFFSYTFTCTGTATFNYAYIAGVPVTYLSLAVYQDATCASVNPVAWCASDSSTYSFNGTQGDKFTFAIGNYNSADNEGLFWLNTSCSGSQSTPTAPTGSTPTAPTAKATPTAPTASTPTAPTAKATPTAPTAKATPTAPTAATPTAPTAPTAPTTTSTTKAPSSAGVVGVGLATVVSFLLL